MGGGGGGAIDFPSYMKDWHKEWLGAGKFIAQDYNDFHTNLIFNNPFFGVGVEDNSTEIQEYKNLSNAYSAVVQGKDWDGDWTLMSQKIKSELGIDSFKPVDIDLILNDTVGTQEDYLRNLAKMALSSIDEAIVQEEAMKFDVSLRPRTDAAIGQLMNAFGTRNASMGSALMMAVSNIEAEHHRQVSTEMSNFRGRLYEKSLELGDRDIARRLDVKFKTAIQEQESMLRVSDSIRKELITMYQAEIQNLSGTVALSFDLAKNVFLLNKERVATNLTFKERKETLIMDSFGVAAGLLAAPTGASGVLPGRPSIFASALSGGISGAIAGAQIGTAVGSPGVGTAIGAAAGLLGGILS